MKLFKSILMGAAVLTLGLTSCNDYLDINNDPNTPTAESAIYYNRLPWCQFYSIAGPSIAASNASFYCGQIIRTGNARGLNATKWNFSTGTTRAANAQQWFLVPCASNLGDMYDKAMAAGAYHYAGAAKFMRAYGFMEMVDLFGECPYTDALGEAVTPKYDTGKTVFLGALAELDEAIELFQRTQESGAEPLSTGDSWNGGDPAKWLKMCYLIKARWLNHLSKKQKGSYKEGKYDPEEILACLEKAQKSNADNAQVNHEDNNSSTHDHEGWDEPVDYSTFYSCIGMNSNAYFVTKMFYDNLTNFNGYGVEDPRADKFIPWARSRKSADTPAEIKWSPDGKWRRALGADIQNTNILTLGGPFASSYANVETYIDEDNKVYTERGKVPAGKDIIRIIPAKSWYCNSANDARQGDTIYIQGRCGGTGYYAGKDQFIRIASGVDESAISGHFHGRPTTPTIIAGYSEACFIKAEVLMRNGDKGGAFAAYKEGIKANIDFVNSVCQMWVNADATGGMKDCPSFTPMTASEINNFLDNGIGTAANITMGMIMTQKQIAMLFTLEQWNDMRRHDYSETDFIGWHKPYDYLNTPSYWDYLPQDKLPRRWQQASYELNYNSANLQAIGAEVPGALDLPASGGAWFRSNQIWTLPVWWDSTQE
ncbi:MAG: SusD/RagB family nutrient-binding outer membrane lipoprotein [Muribaculaceae bacterium]|nr:SusD/RagB family nutrient-binding outer membrane lipoprotein [Muribaculaceae bacterium]